MTGLDRFPKVFRRFREFTSKARNTTLVEQTQARNPRIRLNGEQRLCDLAVPPSFVVVAAVSFHHRDTVVEVRSQGRTARINDSPPRLRQDDGKSIEWFRIYRESE